MTSGPAGLSGASPVEEILRARIESAGRITFAEFMETALYHPLHGYYRRPDRISARGDFYTSPTVHPAFGALICVQLREMWTILGRPAVFHCIEYGAAGGRLARDIGAYAARLDTAFAAALRYLTIDRASSGGAADDGSGSGSDADPVPSAADPGAGCVLSNELLDAFPVHRFVIRNGRVYEMYVQLENGAFVESEGSTSTSLIEDRLGDLVRLLPEGYRGEVCPGIDGWATEATRRLTRGFVITVDFGFDRRDLYSPGHASGMLRCYYRHAVSGDPFIRIGRQDLAAHVDFTALDRAMERAGLQTVGHARQSEFLERLGASELVRSLRSATVSDADTFKNRAALLELLKPEGLGGFRVAIHSKGVSVPRLTGLHGATRSPSPPLPLPLLGDDEDGRVPFAEGRYPHAEMEFKGTWDELLESGPD